MLTRSLGPILAFACCIAPAFAQPSSPTMDVTMIPDFPNDSVTARFDLSNAAPGSLALLFYASGMALPTPVGNWGNLYLDAASMRLLFALPIGSSGGAQFSGTLTPDLPDFVLPLQALVLDPGGGGQFTNNLSIGQVEPGGGKCLDEWITCNLVDDENGPEHYSFDVCGCPGELIEVIHYDQSQDQHFEINSGVIPPSGELHLEGLVELPPEDQLELHRDGSGVLFLKC